MTRRRSSAWRHRRGRELKATTTGDLLLDAEHEVDLPRLDFPEPVMSFAVTPKAKGDEEKVGTSLRRLAEEDPRSSSAATRRPVSSSSRA